jgi:hypothetical protein
MGSDANELRQIDPQLFEEFSALFDVLRTLIRPRYHVGPALSSLDHWCGCYLAIRPDTAKRARLLVAKAEDLELWLLSHAEVPAEVALEALFPKDRGEYGAQVTRAFLHGVRELLRMEPAEQQRKFRNFTT